MKKITLTAIFIISLLLFIPNICNATVMSEEEIIREYGYGDGNGTITEAQYAAKVYELASKVEKVVLDITDLKVKLINTLTEEERTTIEKQIEQLEAEQKDLELEKSNLELKRDKYLELMKGTKIGDLYYLVISKDAKTVKVVNNGNYANLTTITIPSNVEIEGQNYEVTTIKEQAFMGCSSLTSIVIPDSVITIGYGAFARCTNLNNVTISSSVTTIDSATFAYCSKLTNITIPNSVKNINDQAFYQCENLLGVTIPKSVERIASSTFDNSNKVVITTYKGSAAEAFAKTNAIPVVLLDSATEETTNNTKVGYVTIASPDISINGNEIVKNDSIYAEMEEKLKNKGYSQVFCAYELTATGKIENGIELTFDVGTNNNDKEVMILHKKSNGEYEEFVRTVANGQVKITVTEFSPFMLAIKEAKSSEENSENLNNSNNNENDNNEADNGSVTDSNNKLDAEPKTSVEDYSIIAIISVIISLVGTLVIKYKK